MAATEPSVLQADVASEEEHLRIQAEAWEPEVETWLDLIGVQPGWRCADLGCGPMGILAPLSRRAGWRGRVVGVENSSTQAEAARQFVKDNRLESVEVLTASPYDPPLECGAFHLAHARFLIANEGREEELLNELAALVRPGGIVAVQEPDASSWNCYPSRPAFRRLVNVITDACAEAGRDFNAGRRTFGLLRKLGLADVQARAAVVACGAGQPFRNALLHHANALRKHILEADILVQPELDEALSEVRQVLDDPNTLVVSYTVTQVWGRKI